MKKKLICALFNVFLIIFSVNSFSASAANDYDYTCDYIYDMLDTADERKFYDDLYYTCCIVENSSDDYEMIPFVNASERLTYDEVFEIITIFLYDHPEFFWLGDSVYYSSGYGYSITVMDDFISGSSRQFVKSCLEDERQDYIDKALTYNTDYDRIKYIHDRLLYEVEYQMNSWDQTIASVFLNKQTVCAGYSKAFSYLCNAIGIETISILGYNHAWNKVKLDGFWYNIDVTNDEDSYDFFLVSDSKLLQLDQELDALYSMTLIKDNISYDVEFYLHDIDTLTYEKYYNQLPKSQFSYDEIQNMTPTYITGDANNDGIVNVRDCSFIAMFLAQNRVDMLAEHSDFNEDGKINVRDASAIAVFLAS